MNTAGILDFVFFMFYSIIGLVLSSENVVKVIPYNKLPQYKFYTIMFLILLPLMFIKWIIFVSHDYFYLLATPFYGIVAYSDWICLNIEVNKRK
jgi:hypothetical protein